MLMDAGGSLGVSLSMHVRTFVYSGPEGRGGEGRGGACLCIGGGGRGWGLGA